MAVGDETTVPYRPVGQREFELVPEYWIPAADLDGLNDNMVAAIELLRTFPEPSVRAAGPRGRRGGA